MGQSGSSGGGGGGGAVARAALAKAEAKLGVRFAAAGAGRVNVTASVSKLDAALAKDPAYHVGPGGKGPSAVPGRYAGFKAFLDKARATGTKVEPPRGGIDAKGHAYLTDGRHRFAVMRDAGVKAVPVAVRRGEAAAFRRKFGPR